MQLLECENIAGINRYLCDFKSTMKERPTLINNVTIVHQSYENTRSVIKGVTSDNNPQPGPMLGET